MPLSDIEIAETRPVGLGLDQQESLSPTEQQLAILEARIQLLQFSVDNLTECVRMMMSSDQKLRCPPPPNARSRR